MPDSEPLNDAIYTSVKATYTAVLCASREFARLWDQVALSACEADAQEKEAELVKPLGSAEHRGNVEHSTVKQEKHQSACGLSSRGFVQRSPTLPAAPSR